MLIFLIIRHKTDGKKEGKGLVMAQTTLTQNEQFINFKI